MFDGDHNALSYCCDAFPFYLWVALEALGMSTLCGKKRLVLPVFSAFEIPLSRFIGYTYPHVHTVWVQAFSPECTVLIQHRYGHWAQHTLDSPRGCVIDDCFTAFLKYRSLLSRHTDRVCMAESRTCFVTLVLVSSLQSIITVPKHSIHLLLP